MQNSSESKSERIASDREHYQKEINNDSATLFSHAQLNDLIRELNLSKEAAQILGSRLKEKKLFEKDIFAWYHCGYVEIGICFEQYEF